MTKLCIWFSVRPWTSCSREGRWIVCLIITCAKPKAVKDNVKAIAV